MFHLKYLIFDYSEAKILRSRFDQWQTNVFADLFNPNQGKMANGMQWEDLVANEPHLSSLPPTLASTLVRELQGARGISKVSTPLERIAFAREFLSFCFAEGKGFDEKRGKLATIWRRRRLHRSFLSFHFSRLCSRRHGSPHGDEQVLGGHQHHRHQHHRQLLEITGRGKDETQILSDAWLSHQRRNWRR